MLQWPPVISLRSVRVVCCPAGVLSKPLILRVRSRGRIVTRQAAVMATPGSTSVHTIAVVPVSKEDVSMNSGGPWGRIGKRTETIGVIA